MPIKDTFNYEARYDSVGLTCSFCRHFLGPKQWPDTARVSRCALHSVSLAIELNESGYMNWEWFCRDFDNAGHAYRPAVEHLQMVSAQLKPSVLYRLYGEDGFLVEHPMADFQSKS